jgi:hypothetical protein
MPTSPLRSRPRIVRTTSSENLRSADPKNSLAKTNFAFRDLGVAQRQLEPGKPALALKTYRHSATRFDEMASEVNRNRYPRSGPASADSGLADVSSALGVKKESFPRVKPAFIGGRRIPPAKKVSFPWDEKEKRGELNSAECGSRKQATQCIASADTKLHTLSELRELYSRSSSLPSASLCPLSRTEGTELSGAI